MSLGLFFGVFYKPSGYRRGTKWRVAVASDPGPFKIGFAWVDSERPSTNFFGGPYLTVASANRYRDRAFHKWLYRELVNSRTSALSSLVGEKIKRFNTNQYGITLEFENGDMITCRTQRWGGFTEGSFKERYEAYDSENLPHVTSVEDGKVRLSNRHVFHFPFSLRASGLSFG